MFLFGSACLPCHHAPPPAARERSRRSLQLATELVFQVTQSELNERRDLRSWLFFCGAKSTGSFLLKHYIPSREALCSEDKSEDWESSTSPGPSRAVLVAGAAVLQKQLSALGHGQILLAAVPPFSSKIGASFKQPPIHSTLSRSSVRTVMALPLVQQKGPGLDVLPLSSPLRLLAING